MKKFFTLKSFLAYLLPVMFCLGFISVNAQTCTGLGQNPSTAFPVCGTSVYSQEIVPACGGALIPGPCTLDAVDDRNPFWYQFVCFKAGTLGFTITPVNLADDYDWQIFDITGRDPNEVYTDASLFLTCNWSGESGITGASDIGTSLAVCGGFGMELFSAMAELIEGHKYIMLISHFTATNQSGYSLEFSGGTASITDGTPPDLVSATYNCGGTTIGIKLNKPMKCSTLASDGSDFALSPASATITGAVGVGCDNGFSMDSVIIKISNTLPVGAYTITVQTGSDASTILDNCGEGIDVGDHADVAYMTPVVPSVSISASATEITEGTVVTFTATVVNGGPNPSYQWLLNGDAVGTNSFQYTTSTLKDGDNVSCSITTDPEYVACFAATTANSNIVVITVSPLPITLLYFGGTHQTASNVLEWKTTQEVNSAYFDVMKSIDGVNYAKIGQVKAAGNNSHILTYGFTDPNIPSKINYYSLKMVDRDGKAKLSHVVALRNILTNTVTIFPNPVHTILEVQINASRKQAATLQVLDVEGRMLIRQNILLNPGSNQAKINLSSLPAGQYLLVMNGEEKTVLKFMKQ